MKTKQKFLAGAILALILAVSLVLGVLGITKSQTFRGNGIYVGEFTVLAEEQDNGIGEVKCLISVDQKYIILATSINVEVADYKEVGYKITKNTEAEQTFGSNKYYTGITVNVATGGSKTFETATIFYGIPAVGMIVAEIGYDATATYTIVPYLITNEGTAVNGEAIVAQPSQTEEKPTALTVKGDLTVAEGASLQGLTYEVYGTFADGERKLEASEYTLDIPDEAAVLGKSYNVTATYAADEAITANANVSVSAKIEGESGKIEGGNSKTEIEYDAEYNELEEVSFAGNIQKAAIEGTPSYVILYANSYTNTTADLTFRLANSYCIKNEDKTYSMGSLQLNSIMDMTVNGQAVTLGDDVVLPAHGPSATYQPLFGVYFNVTVENVALKAGINAIRLDFKTSTLSQVNCWDEALATVNVDYVIVETAGAAVEEGATVTAIRVDEAYTPAYGDAVANTPVIAVMSDGSEVALDKSLYTVEKIAEENKDVYLFGDNQVKVTLVADQSVTATKTINIEVYYDTLITAADIEVDGDKVWYTFTFNNVGYTPEQYELFSDNEVLLKPAKYDLTTFTVKFYIDATKIGSGANIYPKLRLTVDGTTTKYVNGANSNGDLRGDSLVFEDGKVVELNGSTYTLSNKYEMPSLNVVHTGRSVTITGADLQEKEGRVYYIIACENVGYDPETFQIFDGKTNLVLSDVVTDGTSVELWVDITDQAAGLTFYPHLRVYGANFDGSKNGDVKVSITEETITLGEKTYTLKSQYSMPTFVVA